jgi:hypothetical protein
MGLFKKKPETPETPETTVNTQSEVVDLHGTDLGEQIRHTLAEHGIEPDSGKVVDASSVPGLSEESLGALNQSGVLQQALGGTAVEGGTAASSSDPVDQIARLAELHKQGHLSDLEFETAKQKILDENWQKPAG